MCMIRQHGLPQLCGSSAQLSKHNMNLPKNTVPAGHVANAADPPSRPVAQPHQPSQEPMDGGQLVQWLSVQARNMAGDLQHNVRALVLRASSPMPVSDGHDEVCLLLATRLDKWWWSLACGERHHAGLRLWGLKVVRSINMTMALVSFLRQVGRIQTHGVERRLHDVALLVERQEIHICNAGAPINLAVALMLDECTEIDCNPCYPCVLDVEF